MTKSLVKPKRFKDSDGDGLSDYDETHYFGSDPYNADSDGDGIEDGEAVLNGKDPVGGGSLKDFFIPNKNNNYKPKSLHPKRLLFHATSVLVVKLMIFLLVFFYPMTAWMTPDVSAEEGRKIIALTNNLRKSLSLNPLGENQKLDQAATKKVEDMLINQYFAHLSPQNFDLEHFLELANYKDYISVGENLAMGYKNASEVMTAWEKSPTHYSNLVDPDFSEIGVALTGGTYKNLDTVFIAQYFALPQVIASSVNTETINKKPSDIIFEPGGKAVLSQKTAISIKEAKIVIDEPVGAKNDKIVKVEAILPPETRAASLEVLDNKIEMTPIISTTTSEETKWIGQAIIQDDNYSITPPTITVSTAAGGTQIIAVNSSNISPRETSLVDQYWLFKNHPNKGLEQIFDISSIYFKILLGLVMIAMLLNFFIQIKKQQPKRILSGLGLILFLIVIIIF